MFNVLLQKLRVLIPNAASPIVEGESRPLKPNFVGGQNESASNGSARKSAEKGRHEFFVNWPLNRADLCREGRGERVTLPRFRVGTIY
jgi:hypothetical protein